MLSELSHWCSLLLVAGLLSLAPMPAIAQSEVRGPRGQVMPGIDVLAAEGFAPLAGKRVGLITNHTGLTRDHRAVIDVLFEAPEVQLVALFAPEHGIRGTEDSKVDSTQDEKTGLPIHSLYGQTRKPTPEMLTGIEVMVFDIQDIGTRFYTYISTMALAMQAAQEQGIAFVVLDRPNPIGGVKVEGAVIPRHLSGGFTAIYPIPTRHGMTIGELARMFNTDFAIGVDLTVVPMRHYERWMHYDDTGLLWVNPSPNMKTLNGALLYPGPGAAETTTLSVGRGLDRPFEMYGAPFMDAQRVAANLARRSTPGVRFVPCSFTPTAPYHQFRNQLCHGVFAIVYDRDAMNSVQVGLHMVQAFYEEHPDDYRALGGFKTSSGDEELWAKLTEQRMTPEEIMAGWQADLDAFIARRAEYLLY